MKSYYFLFRIGTFISFSSVRSKTKLREWKCRIFNKIFKIIRRNSRIYSHFFVYMLSTKCYKHNHSICAIVIHITHTYKSKILNPRQKISLRRFCWSPPTHIYFASPLPMPSTTPRSPLSSVLHIVSFRMAFIFFLLVWRSTRHQ